MEKILGAAALLEAVVCVVFVLALIGAYFAWARERKVAEMVRSLLAGARKEIEREHARTAALRQRIEDDLEPLRARAEALGRCVDDLRTTLDGHSFTQADALAGSLRETLRLHGQAGHARFDLTIAMMITASAAGAVLAFAWPHLVRWIL